MDKSSSCAVSLGTCGHGTGPAGSTGAVFPGPGRRLRFAKLMGLAAAIIAICTRCIRRDLANIDAFR